MGETKWAVPGENNEKNLISKKEIISIISARVEIPPETIKSLTRKREIVVARQICMYMAKNYRTDSLATIGEFYGKKDHATVLHSCKTINNLIDTDKGFRRFIKEMEEDVCEKINNKNVDEETYICGECNSRDVEIKKWIKINTKKPSDYEAFESNDTWCCNCKRHGTLRLINVSELEKYPVS